MSPPTPRVVPYSSHEGDTVVWFTNSPEKWNVRKRNGIWWIYPPWARNPEASTTAFPEHYELCLAWVSKQRAMGSKALLRRCCSSGFAECAHLPRKARTPACIRLHGACNCGEAS